MKAEVQIEKIITEILNKNECTLPFLKTAQEKWDYCIKCRYRKMNKCMFFNDDNSINKKEAENALNYIKAKTIVKNMNKSKNEL